MNATDIQRAAHEAEIYDFEGTIAIAWAPKPIIFKGKNVGNAQGLLCKDADGVAVVIDVRDPGPDLVEGAVIRLSKGKVNRYVNKNGEGRLSVKAKSSDVTIVGAGAPASAPPPPQQPTQQPVTQSSAPPRTVGTAPGRRTLRGWEARALLVDTFGILMGEHKEVPPPVLVALARELVGWYLDGSLSTPPDEDMPHQRPQGEATTEPPAEEDRWWES